MGQHNVPAWSAEREAEAAAYQDAARKVMRVQVATPVLAALLGSQPSLDMAEAAALALAAADELVRKVEEG